MRFGWTPLDDLFTPAWVDAAVDITPLDRNALRCSFKPLSAEMPEVPDIEQYDVTFRRTVGVRVMSETGAVRALRIFTRFEPTSSRLRVELHAGRPTAASRMTIHGYNAVLRQIIAVPGIRAEGNSVWVEAAKGGRF